MQTLKIFKIGGNVVDNPQLLGKFLADFNRVSGDKIIVHGGGKEATRLASALDVPVTMIEGRRVTDRRTLDIVTMVYAGLVNKRVVAALQATGCNAVGLSGADGDAVRAVRRAPEPVDYGYVGDINASSVNVRLLTGLLDSGMTPVLCAITHDGDGSLLNCNADTIASSVAVALSSVRDTELIYCFEQPGVLSDINDKSSVIPLITPDDFPALKESGVISAGMIPKIKNALDAVRKGVRYVTVKSSDDILGCSGTTVRL